MDAKTIKEESLRRLVTYFQTGAKGSSMCNVLGVELEHHVVAREGTPVSYEPSNGLVGVRELLEYLTQWYPRQTFNEYRDLVGLVGNEGSVTLEPAAQIELSAAPYESVDDIRQAYENFYARVYEFLVPRGVHLESLGYHPTSRAQQLSLIPKRRYDLMDAYFSNIGSDGDRMMRASASTQVSVDYADEADAVRKMRVASALAPILAAIADNVPVFEGRQNHVPIRRLQLWREVDYRRCGTVPNVFNEGFGFESYAMWLLSTPPIFVTRPAVADSNGDTIRPFFDEPAFVAFGDAPLGPADVEHLISMFWPDVRLKRFVEIRPADSLPLPSTLGYAALIKGIFYSKKSLRCIEDALGVDPAAAVSRGAWNLTEQDVDEAIRQVQTHGLAGRLYGKTLGEWEKLVFLLARQALDEGEAAYLEPLEDFAGDKPWWHVM